MKKVSYCLIILISAFLTASCYKLISTYAPSEVEPGQTFEVSFTIVDDGSDTQNFVTDWSYAGVRVPSGWTVTVPQGAHQQFAEDWVYYSDGSKVNSAHNMEPCDKLTQFYNTACPKSNYTWAGFKSVTKIPKNISACWRNGCDSIRVTFLVTVPEDAKPGSVYSLSLDRTESKFITAGWELSPEEYEAAMYDCNLTAYQYVVLDGAIAVEAPEEAAE